MDAEPFGFFDRYFYCSGVRGINRRSLAGLLLRCKLFRFWWMDWFSGVGERGSGLDRFGGGFRARSFGTREGWSLRPLGSAPAFGRAVPSQQAVWGFCGGWMATGL